MVSLVYAYVPPSTQRDELVRLVRLGFKFKQQHRGRKPGFLSQLTYVCADRTGPPYTFDRLLIELSRLAAQREIAGEQASPIEKVSRAYQLVTLHAPGKGRAHVPFATIRNHLTTAKKRLMSQFPPAPIP